MATYYVVPDESGYGSWATKTGGRNGRKKKDHRTQQTAINWSRRNAPTGTNVKVYGSRKNRIVNEFTVGRRGPAGDVR